MRLASSSMRVVNCQIQLLSSALSKIGTLTRNTLVVLLVPFASMPSASLSRSSMMKPSLGLGGVRPDLRLKRALTAEPRGGARHIPALLDLATGELDPSGQGFDRSVTAVPAIEADRAPGVALDPERALELAQVLVHRGQADHEILRHRLVGGSQPTPHDE